jgi:sterol desaturase/sphingolipid hydroxylase (fatty acid hydroxylase superfamily)
MSARTANRAGRALAFAGFFAALGAFAALAIAERARPLRTRGAPDTPRRLIRNLALAGISAAAVQVAERPILTPLANAVVRRRWGLLPRLGLPAWAETTASVLLMDYTLYLWHVMTHRVPLLWRFHRVHHADLDLDASTAIRFHFGEFVLGVPYRTLQVALIGVGPRSLTLWQRLTLIEVLFHHSNLRLPPALERRLVRLVVTPRMHGIHHSIVADETNANWSSGLSIWDHLHGTLRLNVPQAAVTIGDPELRRPDEVTLPKMVAMPFARQRPCLHPPGRAPRLGRPTDLAS